MTDNTMAKRTPNNLQDITQKTKDRATLTHNSDRDCECPWNA